MCMTTRIEIIAQLDDEITRLERARDFLAAALASAPHELKKTASAIASLKKIKLKTPAPARKRKQPEIAAVPVAVAAPLPPAPPAKA